MNIPIDIIVNRAEGLISFKKEDRLICRWISKYQQIRILELILMMLPKKRPTVPYPKCKKNIVEERQIPVVMMDMKLYRFMDSFPFAKRKASITPLSPRKTRSTAQVCNACTDSSVTHFQPQSRRSTVSEQLQPKLMISTVKQIMDLMKVSRAATDSSYLPLLK